MRDVGQVWELVGDLVCESPLHVGDWGDTLGNRLTVQRDGQGRLLLPGTSLAGALRTWLSRAELDDGTTFDVATLFGHIVEGTDRGQSSWIRVDDAVATGSALPEHRAGVGIDRTTGSAARDFLYDREVVPRGTRFSIRILAEAPAAGSEPSAGQVCHAVNALTGALQRGQIRVGARTSAGLGRVLLAGAKLRHADLSTRDGLIDWLQGRGWAPVEEAPAAAHDGRVTITVDWKAATPVLSLDSVEGSVVDALPRASIAAQERDGVRLGWLLPGTSIKGALRAHAERIVRTLRGLSATGDLRSDLVDPRLPEITTLFGSPGNAGSGDTGWRGALEVSDCLSRDTFDMEDWQAVRTAAPPPAAADPDVADRAALRAALERLDVAVRPRVSDHVAIDRWTGGAAAGLLFSVLEPASARWGPITLTVDTRRAGPHALVLLLLVLRDLRDGWLGLGFGTTRGRGSLTVTSVRLGDADGAGEPWRSCAGKSLDDLILSPPASLEDAVQAWAAATATTATTAKAAVPGTEEVTI